jgi:tetratricopeptide (TPR) repeat protein
LAVTEFRRPFLEPLPPREAWPAAAQAARRALELDGSLAEAHGTLAAIKFRLDWDVAGADAEWKRALELDPNDADTDVHWGYSVFLRTSNRYQEAIDEAKRARELDPVVPDRRAGLGEAYLIARKYDLAIEELRQVVARYPDGVLGYVFLGVAYEQKGLRGEAISALEQSVKLSRDPLYLAALAHAYGIFGRSKDAERILQELQQRAKREYVSPYTIAVVWMGVGNKEQALAWLEKAYVDRSFHLVTINSWPWFDPLRSELRFQNLVRRIGLDPDRAIPR